MSAHPRTVAGTGNNTFFYWQEQLELKLFSRIQFDNIPSYWDADYMKLNIFRNGLFGVTNVDGYGPLRLQCSRAGVNVYNSPTIMRVANAVIGNFDRTIGVDCELVYLFKNGGYFYTTNDIITRYAELLAQCDATLNTTLINSRVAHIFKAETDAELKTYQKIYDDVTAGKPRTFVKKNAMTGDISNDYLNVKQTYIGGEILDAKRTIMNEFLTEIGVNNANTDKKERLITAEIERNTGETMCLIDLWIYSINQCLTKVNKMFGLNIKCRKVDTNPQAESDDQSERKGGESNE